MWRKLIVDHPKSVGETYFEHMSAAFGFGFAMVISGIACLVHGLVPGLFVKTGSRTIASLHDRMVLNRARSHGPAHGRTAQG